jgi:hypothetical protein
LGGVPEPRRPPRPAPSPLRPLVMARTLA